MTSSPRRFHRDGTELVVHDFGGDGRAVLLLHGLAGYGGEWTDTAARQASGARVLAPDARGHGLSQRSPADVSPRAHADDVAFLAEQLGLRKVVLIGHSLGGITALLLAAHRPDLVAGLVLAEAGPRPADGPSIRDVESYLASWPASFGSRDEAERFFGGPSLRARRWADGLEEDGDGFRATFDHEVMSRTLREAATRDYWAEWSSIRCPILIARAENGMGVDDEVDEMLSTNPGANLTEISGAGHDLHLDRPKEWNARLTSFLKDV